MIPMQEHDDAMPAIGTLADEPDDLKGLRMLRTLRAFVASDTHYQFISLNGMTLLVVKTDIPGVLVDASRQDIEEWVDCEFDVH